MFDETHSYGPQRYQTILIILTLFTLQLFPMHPAELKAHRAQKANRAIGRYDMTVTKKRH